MRASVGRRSGTLDGNRDVSWQPETPVEFLATFAGLWVGISLLLGLLSGWTTLAGDYRLSKAFVGRKWYFCSASFRRFVNYGGVLTVGASDKGLYLSLWMPFRIGHPPLLVPWQHVRKLKHGLFSLFSTALVVGYNTPVRVSLSSRLVRRVEEAIGHELPYAV